MISRKAQSISPSPTLAINSKFIDRGNNHGYRLCESVNVGMNNDGDNFYSLSTQKQFVNLILNLSDDEIDHILNSDGVVFRNSFMEKLRSERVLSKNEYFAKAIVNAIDLDKILNAHSYDFTVSELTKINGVGPKVAACTALFGFGNLEAFPIDVWMRRAIDTYFGGELDPKSLGSFGGVAQQYIFHYIRLLSK